MATVGNILTAPEAGWKRYDDNDPNLTYSGPFIHYANTVGSIAYGGTYTQGEKISCRFNFRGTKLRLIGVNPSTGYTPDGVITIDGVQVATFNQKGVGDNHFNFINADVQGLLNKEHTVAITCGSAILGIDAIDIDEDGQLGPYNPIVVAAPTNLTATPGDSQVTLNWDAVTGATGYSIKRSTTAGGPYTTTVATNVSGTSYVDTSVVNGTTYYYVVTAVNADGESANSNEASATPAISVPLNLTATAGNSQVALSWTAVANVSGYNVKRSTTAGGPYTTIAGNVATNSYTDTTVTNGTTYYYVVTALGGTSESANSNEASATPVAPINVLLRITMNDSSEREYKVTQTVADDFIGWCNRTIGTGNSCYVFDKSTQGSKEYLFYEKIISFEVIPLPAE